MDQTSWMFDGGASSSTQHFPGHHEYLNFDSPSSAHAHSAKASPAVSNSTPGAQIVSGSSSEVAAAGIAAGNGPSAYSDYLGSDAHMEMLSGSLTPQAHDAYDSKNKENDMGNWPELHDIDMAQIETFLPDGHGDILLDTQISDHHHNGNGNGNGMELKHSERSTVPPTPSSYEVQAFNGSTSSFLSHYSPVVNNTDAAAGIRPDVVFTPLVSPAVTPLDSLNQHKQTGVSTSFFSPLTSPALEAKSPMKHAKRGSVGEEKKKYHKRKTPGSTPSVAPTVPGRIAKQSPIMKAKRSTSYASSINIHQHQQQHQQQHPQQHQSSYNPSSSDGFVEVTLPESAKEVMAPPKTITTSSSSNGSSLRRTRTKSNASENQPATPSTLINFKLDSTLVPSNALILPSNDPSRRSSVVLLGNKPQPRTIPLDTSSASRTNNSDEEDLNTKKTSHKLAEQGRRNRMNIAIADLGTLIPEELQNSVAIPSKATTVELATLYIQNLVSEIHSLRESLRLARSDSISNESISPLETTDHNS